MPVRKFRSIEEMEGNTWKEAGDPALWRSIEWVWSFGARIGGSRFPQGVFKHRTIEEMDRLREEWAAANFREFRKRQEVARAELESRGTDR